MEYKDLNVCQKLQIVRDLLNNTKMSKTGFNKFSNYAYYQTSDFMPFVQKYCREVGICPIVTFDKETEEAIMIIINSDKMDERLEFKVRYSIPNLKGSNTSQMIGGMTTFFSRYLYQIAFAITENDAFDCLSEEQNTEVELNKEKKDELISTIKKNVKKNENVANALKDLIKKRKVTSVSDLSLNDLQEVVDLI